MIFNMKRLKTQSGFTLIETFVAVTILVMAIVGPLTMASQSASYASFARDQTVANFLAQDAIEYVRWIRDTNQLNYYASPTDSLLTNASWLNGGGILGPCIGSTCYFDSSWSDLWTNTNHLPQSCVSSSCPPMRFDESSGLYNYTSGNDSRYTRTVSITESNCSTGKPCEAIASTTVSWMNGTLSHSVTLRETLTRWANY